jgi:hypothetical protein
LTLDLSRPRELGELFRDALRLYAANFGRFLAIGAAVVIPTELIVSGVGLGQLSSGFDDKQPVAANAVPLMVQALVTTPLIVAMTVHLLLDLAAGRPARLRVAAQSGLDAFAPLFLPVLATIACEALVTLVVVVPLVLLANSALVPALVIPLMLAVRLYFVPQAVVAGGARRVAALRASWELTRGFGWRVFGTVILGYIGFGLVAQLAGTPLLSAAKSADSGALVLASRVVAETLAAPAVALLSALLYFDLKARRASRN